MSMLEERLRTGLSTEADAWPDPPAPGTARRSARVRGFGVALVAAAAVFVVIGGVAVADRLMTDEVTAPEVGNPPGPGATSTNPNGLPRLSLDLDGWSPLVVIDAGTESIAIFSPSHTREDPSDDVAIYIRSDAPDEPAGTTHERVLAERRNPVGYGESLGALAIDEDTTGEAFAFFLEGTDDPDQHPRYHFLWQNSDTTSTEVVVAGESYDKARTVLAGVIPISESAWQRLIAEFQEDLEPTSATTTLPPTTAPAFKPFEAIPFTGDGWQLQVGESANPGSDTYKVCYTFFPSDEPPTDGNGLGVSGCGDWPGEVDGHLLETIPVLESETRVVLFLDLNTDPIQSVTVTTDSGQRLEVEPYRMPGSGKQFAVVEVTRSDGGGVVEIVDESGAVVESTDVKIPPANGDDPPSITTGPSEAIVEHPVTLSDGTEVTVSLLVAAGSDFDVMWGAGLKRGAYDKTYRSAPFSALVHVWLHRTAEEAILENEEVERLSGAKPVPHRYIVDHDGHAYDFQFGQFSGTDVPQEIIDEWLTAIVFSPSPGSIVPDVTISGDYDVDYGPTYSVWGTYVDRAPVGVSITEGCEVEPGAPVEFANEARASIRSCELDGRVEFHILGTPEYIDRIRGLDLIRLAAGS